MGAESASPYMPDGKARARAARIAQPIPVATCAVVVVALARVWC